MRDLLRADWPVETLEAMATIVDCPHSTPVLTEEGPFVARSQDIRTGVFRTDLAAHVSEETYRDRTRRTEPRHGDLLFSREGTYFGIAAEVPGGSRVCLGQRTVLIRPDPERVDSRFLRLWLNSPVLSEYATGFHDGSVAQRLNVSTIRRLPVPVPPLDQQRHISGLLGALDDKVALNRRMNRTLEAMAAALFRSWFVDFDPVVAKAEERRAVGVSEGVHEVMPSHFVESAEGPIPEGWTIASIQDVGRFVNGRNFTTGATGRGRLVIRIAELNSGPGGSTIYNDVAAPPENVASSGDLLFSWSGSLGVYRWYRDEALINQHIFKVVCEAYPQWFVHQQLDTALPFFQEIAAGKATTMGHIKREHLAQARIVVPPLQIVKVASLVFQPMYDRVLAGERESLALASLRDTLLPQLLSGAVRLREAEKVVEAAV
jgi:type I restriction enzyme S subunit